MSKWWWPFGRSDRPDGNAPASPPAPAVTAEPAWRRLAPVQRTVGDIEPTAQFGGFNAELTTAQSPVLTGTLDLVAAGHSHELPVLDAVKEAGRPVAAAQHIPAPAQPASRKFAPSPPNIQRALRHSEPTASLVEGLPKALLLHAVERADATGSMIDAPMPGERRPLDVVRLLDSPSAATSASWSAAPPAPPAQTALQRTTEPTQPSAVTNPGRADRDESLPLARDAVIATPMTAHRSDSLPTVGQPSRTLQSVQRARQGDPAAHEGQSASARFTPSESLPVLSVVDPPNPRSAPRDGLTTPTSSVGIQRAAEPTTATSTAADTTPPDGPALQRTSGAIPDRTTAPHDTDAPAASASPDPAQAVAPSIELRHVPGADVPFADVAASVRAPDFGETHVAQPLPSRSGHEPASIQRSSTDTTNSPRGFAVASQAGADIAGPSRSAIRPTDSDAHAGQLESVPVQRIELPVVPELGPAAQTARATASLPEPHPPEPPRQARPQLSPYQSPSHQAGPAPVQRAAAPGRLVVLPPLRRTPAPGSHGDGTPLGADRVIVAESSRPVGLQRMFEHTVRRSDDAPAPSRFDHPTWSAGDEASSGATSTSVQAAAGHHFDAGANTITFGQPTIQRAPEEDSPPANPPPVEAAPATTVSATPAATPAAPPMDMDELVNRLYDPLAARLRAELWLDRDRAGALMDLGR
jgi:hypothetical protein